MSRAKAPLSGLLSENLRFTVPPGEVWVVPHMAQMAGEDAEAFVRRVMLATVKIVNVGTLTPERDRPIK